MARRLRPETQALVDRALAMHEAGEGAAAIGRALGKSTQWWSFHKRRLGLDVRPMRPVTQDELRMIHDLRALGASYDIIDVAIHRGRGWTGQSRGTDPQVRDALEAAELLVADDVDESRRPRAVETARRTRTEIRDEHALMVRMALDMLGIGSTRREVVEYLGVSASWMHRAAARSPALLRAMTERPLRAHRRPRQTVARPTSLSALMPRLGDGLSTIDAAEALGVSRQRAHQVLTDGVKAGLIERIEGRPILYRAALPTPRDPRQHHDDA